MSERFTWTDARDDLLRAHWLDWPLSQLMLAIGCCKRSLYKRAAELGLPPRDPVRRALASGAPPARHRDVTLPRVSCLEETCS